MATFATHGLRCGGLEIASTRGIGYLGDIPISATAGGDIDPRDISDFGLPQSALAQIANMLA